MRRPRELIATTEEASTMSIRVLMFITRTSEAHLEAILKLVALVMAPMLAHLTTEQTI